MGSEQFSLCWNNFHNNLSNGFHTLLQGEHLVDVTLAAEGGISKAHKVVLSVCSPYFNELFRLNPCKHPIVILKDVSVTALDQLLTFMYKGEVSVRQDELTSFIRTAETLQIKGLTGSSSSFISEYESHLNSLSSTFFDGTKEPNLKRDSSGASRRKQRIKNTSQSVLVPPSVPIVKPPSVPLDAIKNGAEAFPAALPSPFEPAVFSLNVPSTSHKIQLNASEDAMEIASHQPFAKRACLKPVDESSASDDRKKAPSEYVSDEKVNCIAVKSEPPDDVDFDCSEDSMDPVTLLDLKVTNNNNCAEKNDNHTKTKSAESESSAPGTTSNQQLRFLTSARGLPVLVFSGHMYTLDERRNGKTMWVCVKRKILECQGCVTTTMDEAISHDVTPKIIAYAGHNHANLNDIIERIQAKDCVSVTQSK